MSDIKRLALTIDNTTLQIERRSTFLTSSADNQMVPVGTGGTKSIDFRIINDLWMAKRAKASYILTAPPRDEIIYGPDLSLSDDEVMDIEDRSAAKKEPYGDVKYADPGYQPDGKKRYPIDTEAHIRAAWSYINQTKNQSAYSSGQVSKIKSRIVSAWKRVIDKSGPPSA